MNRAICTVLAAAVLLAIGVAALNAATQLIVGIAFAFAAILILGFCLALGILCAMRAGWRHVQAARAREELAEFEAEFAHITPEYVSRLADSYLTEEDFA